jgi:uridylate kinase (EC 2.7.4.22)
MSKLAYKRLLLKISGEALAGPAKYGIDPETVSTLCEEIAHVSKMGLELALVIGAAIFLEAWPHLPKA